MPVQGRSKSSWGRRGVVAAAGSVALKADRGVRPGMHGCRHGGVAERQQSRAEAQRARSGACALEHVLMALPRLGSSAAAAGAASSGGAVRQAAAQLPCSAFECRE